MKKLYLAILSIFFSILVFDGVYAINYSEFYRYESTTTAGYSQIKNEVYFNQLMNLENINVKFTQDANDYMFHITGKINLDVYNTIARTNSHQSASSLVPLLYKTENFGEGMYIEESGKVPYADCHSGSMYENSTVKISNEVVAYYKDSYRLTSDGHKDMVTDKGGNDAQYYIPNDLRSRDSKQSYNYNAANHYPEYTDNNGKGVKILKNSISYNYGEDEHTIDSINCLGNYTANINIEVAIDKNYIDDYRYICFAQSYFLNTSGTFRDLTTSVTGLSLCTQTVDLKEYANCDHNWVLSIVDKTNHTKYCANCEWEITEKHNYQYEYDNMKNDICTCSYIKKVKYQFKINDDFNKDVTKTFDTDSEYTKVEFKKKTGYNFRYYDVYEKRLSSSTDLSVTHNELNVTKLGTSTTLPDKTGQTSMIFEAVYDPIHFTINYSNENNKNIVLSGNIAPQTIAYDSTAYLRKNIHYVGYVFKGWSKTKKGESIDLSALQEVTNYSAVDDYNLTIYPVYVALDFKLIYSSGRGHFSDGSTYKAMNYTYHDDKELENVIVDDKDIEFSHYIDDIGNTYYKMSDIKDMMEKNGIENVTLNLFPLFKKKESTTSGKEEETMKKSESTEPATSQSLTDPTVNDEGTSGESRSGSGESSNADKNTEPSTKRNDISPEEEQTENGKSAKEDNNANENNNKEEKGRDTGNDTNSTIKNNNAVSYSSYEGGSSGGSGSHSSGNYISSSNLLETTLLAYNDMEDVSINVSNGYNLASSGEVYEQNESSTIIEESSMDNISSDGIDEDGIDGENLNMDDDIATVSVIIRNNQPEDSGYSPISKKELILSFIRNNKLFVAVCSSLFVIFLIIYEIMILRHYCNVKRAPSD